MRPWTPRAFGAVLERLAVVALLALAGCASGGLSSDGEAEEAERPGLRGGAQSTEAAASDVSSSGQRPSSNTSAAGSSGSSASSEPPVSDTAGGAPPSEGLLSGPSPTSDPAEPPRTGMPPSEPDVSEPPATPSADASAVPSDVESSAGAPPTSDGPDVCATPRRVCDGVCRDLSEDAEHCGACGRSCRDDQRCVGGTCICAQGFQQCGSACIDILEDPANCGGCGVACAAVQVCSLGSCVDDCPEGLVVCGGACVDLQSNTRHCGECDAACPGELACIEGLCGCVDGETPCGGVCSDLSSDSSNCGTCGNACAGDLFCRGGTCACAEGLSACGTACHDLQTDTANCGECGNACGPGGVCREGACGCEESLIACGDACVRIADDPSNCGDCGVVCSADRECVAGECSCAGGFTECDGACVDLQVDEDHCGGCGDACKDDEQCFAGGCVACLVNETPCTDGCADLQNDPSNCGGCGTVCPAGNTCLTGTCVCDDDHLSPNHSAETATRLPIGDLLPASGASGALDGLRLCPGREDWFRMDIDAPWSDNVEITLVGDCASASFNPRVELVSASGSVSETATSGGPGGCPQLVARLTRGTRYFRVRAPDGSTGNYGVRLHHPRVRDPTGNTSRGNAVGPYHRSVQLEAQVDSVSGNRGSGWFRFDLHHAGVFSVAFERWGQFSASCRYPTNVEVQDAGGTRVALGTRVGSCATLSVALAPGTHYLRVFSVSPFSSDGNVYNPSLVAVTTGPVFEVEPNDTAATATSLGVPPTSGEGALTRDDVDHWRFSLDAPTSLVIQTRGPFHGCEADTVVELRSADGATLLAATGGGGEGVHGGAGTCGVLRASTHTELQNLPAGEYIVAVRGQDGARGPYLLNVYAE